jgi:hypothetical protein
MKNAQRFGTIFDYIQPYGSLLSASAITGVDRTPYVFGKKAIAKMKCIDCDMNVVEAGDSYMCDITMAWRTRSKRQGQPLLRLP